MGFLLVGNDKSIFHQDTVTFDEREQQIKDQEKREVEEMKRAKNSPFSRWTQFNNEHTKELMWLALKHPKAHAILYFLVDQMDNNNAAMCSSRVFEEVLGVSRQTISKNIKILKNNGFIAVLKSGTSSIYAINDTVYWKSWGNKKIYSKFPASVVLALSEQDEDHQMKFPEIEYIKHKEIKTKGDTK